MSSLGNFVRLKPLHTNELPDHNALNSLISGPKGRQASNGNTPTNGSVTRPGLRHFITHVLDEASRFAQHDLPQTFVSKGPKRSPPSSSEVELLTHTYSQREMEDVPWQDPNLPRQWSSHGPKPAENWFARKSRHENLSKEGTATFAQFDEALRSDHPEHEKDYTPDVYDCYEVLSWAFQIQNVCALEGPIHGEAGQYTEVEMSVREMCHQMPFALFNRVFPVLVLTAKGPQQNSFITVQIPVDVSNVTSAFYSNKRNLNEGDSKIKRKKVVIGIYTSIERGQMLPDENVEWMMATASDAKGWLPMWLQKLGVPGAVIKDVGLVIKWIQGQRQG